jgi:phospholipase C
MKLAAKLLLLISLAATLAHAQTPNTPIKHVIVVIQENRTPDNMFQDSVLKANGADIVDPQTGGKCWTQKYGEQTIPLAGIALDGCTDPLHFHSSWVTQYRSGKMDGACGLKTTSNCPLVWYSCPFDHSLDCSQYTYVNQIQANPVNSNPLGPYFSIAEQYGFANYSFQTNQGPSFPAHQFLLAGTSAPDYFNDPNGNCANFPCWQWFAADNNTTDGGDGDDKLYGCIAATGDVVKEIAPDGSEGSGYNQGFPCYEHGTMPDLLEANGLTWKYYGKFPGGPSNLWTAPNAISHLCLPIDNGGTRNCSGTEWAKVIFPPSPPTADQMAPILEDIENCNLPSVSWVIPDGRYSDHGGASGDFLGPAWVAAIVNAVGGVPNATTPCPNGEVYWNDTVVLVTWDDWGGFYDHVLPWNCLANGVCNGYSNGTGSKYVYGFRVPLLVVSAYNNHTTNGQQGFTGYISGALPGQGEVAPYVHDFGSILNFTEWALGQNQQPLHFPGQPAFSGISPSYAYADVLAPDAPLSCGQQCPKPYSLADFFVDFSKNPQPTPFTPIALPLLLQGYDAEWFENYGTNPGDPGPQDPDQDAIEPPQ